MGCGVTEIPARKFPNYLSNHFADQKDIFISSSVKKVFHGKVVVGYNLNFYNAKQFCELLGAKLATYNQLHAAWEAGLQQCRFVLQPFSFFCQIYTFPRSIISCLRLDVWDVPFLDYNSRS